MDKHRSPNLLSDLPLSIIHVILSLVPIRDAVRTSILSRKWRYIWSSLPYLAFDNKCVNPPMKTRRGEKRLIHFISQALLLHEGPIHKFQLCLPHMDNSQCINQWLLFLSRNGIRILLFESDDYDEYDELEGSYGFEIPSSLYSCQNLTNLKLHVYSIPPPPPSFKGFLFLKSLDIRIYEMDPIIIGSIVSHSPLLEELTLDGIEGLDMTICALNLKYLHYFSAFGSLSLCTPLLQELKGSLSSFPTTTSFSIGVESLVFHYLRTIELYSVPFDNKEVTQAVISLITGSPNLQKLEIEDSFRYYLPKLDYSWDTESAPDFKYNSLKVITINSFGGYTNVLKLIDFLLARSPMLETLMYVSRSSLSNKEIQKLKNQLLNCHCASANAQIVIRSPMIDNFFEISLPVLRS